MFASLFRLWQFVRFYRAAITYHQIHSPLVFNLVSAVLEDARPYYAFRDVEAIRHKMLHSEAVLDMVDYGARAGESGSIREKRSLKNIVRRSGSSPAQGRMLFRLAHWRQPARMLELGTSVGLGALYLASAVPDARLLTLEGSPAAAQVARVNAGILRLGGVEVLVGSFDSSLPGALQQLSSIDLAYIDGFHQKDATLRYVGMLLERLHPEGVLVLDDIHWSAGMQEAWQAIQALPQVRCTIDLYELGIVLISPNFKESAHYRVVPARWKPWRKYI